MHQLVATATIFLFSAAATADPFVYMYTSKGSLLRAELGTDEYRFIGNEQIDVVPNGIVTLETARNGQLWGVFTTSYNETLDTREFGVVATINRGTGKTERLFALNEDPNFVTQGNGLPLGGGMALAADGTMWMANYFLGGSTPISLHQIDTDNGRVIKSVQTNVENEVYGAMVFNPDDTLTLISMAGTITRVNPDSGETISISQATFPDPVTGLTQYQGITYLATQYGNIYSFDLDTYDYQLVSSFGTGDFLSEHGSVWGITVNPTPGTTASLLAGLVLAARRRRH